MPTGGTSWDTAPTVNIYDQDAEWTETSPLAPSAGADRPYFSRWWKLRSGGNDDWRGILTVDTLTMSGGDTVIEVYDAGLNLIARNDDEVGGSTLSALSVTTDVDATYFVRVGTYDAGGSGVSSYDVRFGWEQRAEVVAVVTTMQTPASSGGFFVLTPQWGTVEDPVAQGDQVFVIFAGIPLNTAWDGRWSVLDSQPGQECQGSVLWRTVDAGETDLTETFRFDAPDPVAVTTIILRGWGGWEFLGATRDGTAGDTQPATTLTIDAAGDAGDFFVYAGATRGETGTADLDRGTLLADPVSGAVHGYTWTEQPAGPVTDAHLDLPSRGGHYAAAFALWGWGWGDYIDRDVWEYTKFPDIIQKVQGYYNVYSEGATDIPLTTAEIVAMTHTIYGLASGIFGEPAEYYTNLDIDPFGSPTYTRTTHGRRVVDVAGAMLRDDETDAWYGPPAPTPPVDASPDFISLEGSTPTGPNPRAIVSTVTGSLADPATGTAWEANFDDSDVAVGGGTDEVAVDGTWSTILVPVEAVFDTDSGDMTDWSVTAPTWTPVIYRRGMLGIVAHHEDFDVDGLDLSPAVVDWASGRLAVMSVVVSPLGTGPGAWPLLNRFNDMSSSGGGATFGARMPLRRVDYGMLPPRVRWAYRHAVGSAVTPTATYGPPLRRYPRADGYGVGPTRHYPPPKSRRVAGGYR